MKVPIWFAILLLLAVVLCLTVGNLGCDENEQTVATKKSMRDSPTDQQLFERKLECGKLLARVEGSRMGPEPHFRKGILSTNPVVFYSPRLNTCVLINAVVFDGQMVVPPYSKYHKETISLEDLLTGQTIEDHEFDLNKSDDAEKAKNFEDNALKRYGTHETPSN